MTDKHGYIYVLTNTSFPEYVKIGYADNVDERVAQLNRSECTPFAFKKYDAKCKWNQDGYLLLKGSKVATTVGKSCPLAKKRMREDYAKYINDEFVLTKDILFESSSAAAKFVTVSSVNGKIYWKNQDGVLLENLL